MLDASRVHMEGGGQYKFHTQSEQQDLGQMPSLGSGMEGFGVPGLRQDWSVQTKESREEGGYQ